MRLLGATLSSMPRLRTDLPIASVVGLVALLAAEPAQAGEEESKTFFAQGRELRLQGRCVDAVGAFRRAIDSSPSGLGALRNIAECEEALSRFASARRTYWDLRVAVLKSGDPKYEGWDTHAEEAFARLAKRVPKLVVHVRGTDTPTVRVNGRPLEKALLDTELEQDVGDVDIVLDDGSSAPPRKTLRLEEGKSYEVVLEAGTTPSRKSGATPGEPNGPSPMTIAGGVSLGVASLSLGGIVVAAVIRGTALDTIEQECPSLAGCDPSLRGPMDDGETSSLLVNVFAVGTAIAGGLGVALLTAGALSPADELAKTITVDIGATVSNRGVLFSARGTF
jgi:hypothetical protein